MDDHPVTFAQRTGKSMLPAESQMPKKNFDKVRPANVIDLRTITAIIRHDPANFLSHHAVKQ